jgi:hypothetical protein
MWEVQDDNGTLHAGNEAQMRLAYEVMKAENPYVYVDNQMALDPNQIEEELFDIAAEWHVPFRGSLKLVQIVEIFDK